MRITEGQLRRIIREELFESYVSFKDRAENITYDFDRKDPTFENNPGGKKTARDLKRIWNEEADHEFMDSLVKIHWIRTHEVSTTKKIVSKMEKFLSISGKNEVSAAGYLPDAADLSSPIWGRFGIMIKGRTTFAANHMDLIQSGFASRTSDDVLKKYEKSGFPRRGTVFNPAGKLEQGIDYILDRESFDPRMSTMGNELIVDNWKPVAIVFERPGGSGFTPWTTGELRQLQALAQKFNLPLIDQRMKTWETALEYFRAMKKDEADFSARYR